MTDGPADRSGGPDPVVRPARVVPAYRRVLQQTEVREVGDTGALADLVGAGGVVVLSGAGISTESGIPDYRGPQGALRRHAPMTYQEFVAAAGGRRRYWARSFVGWPRIAAARPNDGHRAVAALEAAGHVDAVITQNVDGLHQAAGARAVEDLHGRLDRVVCLQCRAVSDRHDLEVRLRAANPTFADDVAAAAAAHVEQVGRHEQVGQVNPDGDVDAPEPLVDGFVTVPCTACDADALKPDVVFFGENVPADRVRRCVALIDGARALLVLGSSLTVMSGYRFVLQAHRRETPVAIVNAGPTRGDDRAVVRLDSALGPLLRDLAARLT